MLWAHQTALALAQILKTKDPNPNIKNTYLVALEQSDGNLHFPS